MITVNELRISDHNLIINIAIDSTLCATEQTCLIKKVEIYNQTNYNESSTTSEFNNINATTFNQTVLLDSNVEDFEYLKSTDLIFVKVYWDGTPASDCPCGADVSPENFAVYDKQLVYKKGMKYLSELSNCCADKTGAIDFILTQKYFDLSLNNGAIVDAIDLWGKMMEGSYTTATNNCGCNG